MSLPWGKELVHAVGLLDAPKNEVTNVKRCFLDVAIVIASKLLIMSGLSHDYSKSLFFEAIEVDMTCLFDLSFLVEMDAWKLCPGRSYWARRSGV
jgi:hypothetical protein